MTCAKFLLCVAVLLLVGLSLAGQGIEGVVGDGPWRVAGCKISGGTLELTLLGKAYTFDYQKEIAPALTSLQARGDSCLREARQIWERARARMARPAGE